jgi:poly(hydroxyalkanoate) depolymerase family esterase
MSHATALTRAGKLTEATAYIQQMLGGTVTAPADETAQTTGPTNVIEGTFTRLDPVEAEKPASAPKRRKPLAETLQHIARGGMPAQKMPLAQATSGDARFTTHSYSGATGSRDYMLFLPDAPGTEPLPIVVMLHGCTQSPRDFATGTGMNLLAAEQGTIVIYPAQPSGANISKCWNWFRPADQGRDAGEPAILAGIVRQVLAQQNADPARIYVAGLSAGGAAAVILAQAYPDLFAAVGVHSGLAAGAARDIPSALAAMRNGAAGDRLDHSIPTIVFHGTADATVDLKNGLAVARQAQVGLAGKHTVTRAKAAAGRSYERTVLDAPDGRSVAEVWLIDGAGHAWAGGSAKGSFTDPAGPDASAEMLRFFGQHRLH